MLLQLRTPICRAGTEGDNNGGCQSCPTNSYSTNGLDGCISCPVDSTSTSGSTSADACICNQGYEKLNDTCSICSPGTEGDNNGGCQSCPANSYSTSGLEGCIACPVSSTSISGSISADSCTCDQGYEKLDGVCIICPPGTEGNNNGGCQTCLANFYSTSGLDGCIACPVDSTSTSGSTSADACICNQGYEKLNDTCSICPAGTEGDNNGGCQSCPANSYSTSGLEGCIACPVNSTSVSGSISADNCICDQGYEKQDGICTIGGA